MSVSEVVSRWRSKFPSLTPKVREIVSADGEVLSSINLDGSESLDPTPMAPPVGYRRQPSLAEQIREMVRSEKLAQELAATGAETFEEADDFDVEDEFDPSTPWENDFDPAVRDMIRDGQEVISSREKAEKEAADKAATVTKPAKPAKSAERSSEAEDNLDD